MTFKVRSNSRWRKVSGEAATGAQQTTFNAMDQFVNVMTDPFLGMRSGGAPGAGANGYADEAISYTATRKRKPAEQDAYAKMAVKAPPLAVAFERRWSVWGAGYGGTQTTDGNTAVGSNNFTSRIGGGAAGFDYRLDPNTLVGFSLGGAGTTSISRMLSAADVRRSSRPASTAGTRVVPPTSQAPSPMAGRTSPPIASRC